MLTTLGLPASLQTYMQQGDVDEFPGHYRSGLLQPRQQQRPLLFQQPVEL